MVTSMPMPRETSMLPKWKRFVDALGGRDKAMQLLGIGPSTLYRWTHGTTKQQFSGDEISLIRKLAKKYKATNPLLDVQRLELLGAALLHIEQEPQRHMPTRAIAHVRSFYTEEDLVSLAEDDSVSANVLRAVTLLLE